MKDNFRFFVDNITLEKAGKDKKGRDIMKVGGIATTKDKDTDGEEIDEGGWDVSYFVDNGFFNYNHQSKFNPRAVIGEPTKAKVTKDGVYVEGFLYGDSELAKSVYDTTKMLEGSSGNRRMGFSIEGKALERDPFNPKKITKARLTGCALTLNPKNPNTLVNIIKGDYHENDFIVDYKDIPEEVRESLKKAESFIIHLERDGKLVQIDKDLNIKITDSSTQLGKSLSTVSAEATLVESAGDTTKDNQNIDTTKKNLTKGEVYSEIFNYIYSTDLEKADLMYRLIEESAAKRKRKMKKEDTKVQGITKEDIQKSLDIVLGIHSETEVLQKAEVEVEVEVEKEEEEEEEASEESMEKSMKRDKEYQRLMKSMEEATKSLDMYKSRIEKGEISGYPTTVKAKEETLSDPNAPSIGKEGEFISKGEVESLVKGLESVVSVKLDEAADLVKSLAVATKGILGQNDSLQKSHDEAVEVNNDLRKSLEDTLERLERVEKTPIPSRTVTSQNYSQHPTLEKSLDGGSRVLDAVRDKREILDLLDRKAGLDTESPNMMYAQSMAAFESSGAIEKSVVLDLEKSEGIEIKGI